jgi:hypothetical protein
MFDLQESLEKYLSELKKGKSSDVKKKAIKASLTRSGIIDKNGKLRKLPIN